MRDTAPCYVCLARTPTPGGDAAPGDDALVDAARGYSPRVRKHTPHLVTLDAGGLERLFGSPRALGDLLRRELATRGCHAHVAVAGTQTAARLLALTRPGLTVVEPGAEAEALASLPLRTLGRLEAICPAASSAPIRRRSGGEGTTASTARRLAPGVLDAFTRWGLRTLGQVAALPPAELSARLGAPALAWRMVARGEDVEPFVPDAAEERFEASLELEWPIEGLEPLSFVLTRLLEPLAVRLERRDRGVARLHVALDLVTDTVHARCLQLPAPLRDVRTLRTLALVDLESHPPGAAIDRVSIVIDPTPGRVLQHTLFARDRAQPGSLATLVARLGALMGQDRIGAPMAVDSHRPGACEMQAFPLEHADADPRAASPLSTPGAGVPVASALRRCRRPVPARVTTTAGRPTRVVTDRQGFAGGLVLQAAGPWRTSGAWWERPDAPDARVVRDERETRPGDSATGATGTGGVGPRARARETAWDRDEWDVALGDGAVYRVVRDRTSGAWTIDGIVD